MCNLKERNLGNEDYCQPFFKFCYYPIQYGIEKSSDFLFYQRDFQKRDRRKVFVKLNMENVTGKIFPLYASLAENMDNALSKFTSSELELVSNFIQISLRISQADLETLSAR